MAEVFIKSSNCSSVHPAQYIESIDGWPERGAIDVTVVTLFILRYLILLFEASGVRSVYSFGSPLSLLEMSSVTA